MGAPATVKRARRACSPVGDEAYTVCGQCSAQVRDPGQSRCPHCLERLSVRRFRSREDLMAFREDRAAHGADVPDDTPGGGRPAMATILAASGMLLTLGGLAVGLAAYLAGGVTELLGALGQAFPMLAFGVAMAVVARRMGGQS